MKEDSSSIIYFLTQSLFLGFGISIIFLQSGKDSYIGVVMGIMLGFLIMQAYEHLIILKNNKSLIEIFSNNKIVGVISRIIFIIISVILLMYIMVIFKIFVTSFLLINSPPLFIIIPFLGISTFSAFKGLTNVTRVSNCLLPISIILFIFSILSLVSYFNFDNFLPVLTTKPTSISKTAITFAGISTFPNILTFNLKGNIKNYSKMYVLASITILAMIFLVNGVFSEQLIRIFRFPEYMVLKQLKVFSFIEKVENILTISWIFALFVASIMSIYSINENLPKKKNKLFTIIILIGLTYLLVNIFSFDYTYELKLYYLLPYLAFISSILIIIPMWYLIKKTNNHQLYSKHH